MLIEAFRRLSEFGTVNSYRYIGLGSAYFSDFSLVHKALHITNMISIEQDEHNRGRFEFNCPFKCIDIKFGRSVDILPTLDWKPKTILWLDYDGCLDSDALADIRLFSSSAAPGSLIVVTVNARPSTVQPDKASPRLDQLQNELGKERIPPGVKEGDLSDWGTANVYRRIVNAEILNTLSDRNGGLIEGSKINYKPLFDFRYRDGAQMVTIGGLIYDQGQALHLAKCGFENLDFIRSSLKANSKPCMIDVPMLTYRELRHLDRQLPRSKNARLKVPKVPPREVKKYEDIYPYFPTFAETEV
jgi:hypothetical protein